MRIDRHNPYNSTDGLLSESVAAELAAELAGLELAELAAVLAALRETPIGETIPVAVPRLGWQPTDLLADRVLRLPTAGQLADVIRHLVSQRIVEARKAAQDKAARERLSRTHSRSDRWMRQNGDARRGSVVVLS